jgi:hypothetical protein
MPLSILATGVCLRQREKMFYVGIPYEYTDAINAYSAKSHGNGRINVDVQELLMLKAMQIARKLRIDRLLLIGGPTYAFADFFKGMEKVKIVKRIFGKKTENVLRNLKVRFSPIGGYMWVDPLDGYVTVNSNYLNNGERIDIYLDIIHELVHVRQFMEGKALFDSDYSYVERPTEIEAYRYAVEEARRLGLDDDRICKYLKTEWMSDSDLNRLAKTLNVKCESPPT